MIESVLVVVLALVVGGAVLRLLSWGRRERVVRAIDPAAVRQSARGVSLRVLTEGTTTLPGMNPQRANRTTGDLVLTDDRFVLVSNRGVLADVRMGQGPRITSVRSPGPGRLVLEGEVPTGRAEPGRFRVETVVDDAPAWVAGLSRFCRPAAGT